MAAATIRRMKKSVIDCEELKTRASILSVKITEVEKETAKANSWRRSNRVCKQLPCYNSLLNSLTGHDNVEKRGFTVSFRSWSSSIGTSMNRIVQFAFRQAMQWLAMNMLEENEPRIPIIKESQLMITVKI